MLMPEVMPAETPVVVESYCQLLELKEVLRLSLRTYSSH